jgi:hypothetical protein
MARSGSSTAPATAGATAHGVEDDPAGAPGPATVGLGSASSRVGRHHPARGSSPAAATVGARVRRRRRVRLRSGELGRWRGRAAGGRRAQTHRATATGGCGRSGGPSSSGAAGAAAGTAATSSGSSRRRGRASARAPRRPPAPPRAAAQGLDDRPSSALTSAPFAIANALLESARDRDRR